MPPPLKRLRDDQFGYWESQHLLNRAGFGGTPAQVRALANMGLEDAVRYVVRYHDIETAPVAVDSFDPDIMRPASREERAAFRRLREENSEAAREAQRRERQRRQGADREQIREIQRWWLRRMIETPRPLEERMTLFWHGHFATGYRTIEDSYHMFAQNQLFRANAVGDFRDLAYGIIHDPAMLRYLNNNQNNRQRPNENLARELMELFTIGEGNGYTEDDIKQGARALTGYTYVDDSFRFNERQHDAEAKTVFGATGNWDGDDFVRLIFERRGRPVSQYIALKLYRFFVNDLPGDDESIADENRAYIVKLAARLRERNWSIGAVLETIFLSEHFYSPSNRAAQIKSPIHLIVQAVRSLRTPTRSLAALADAAGLMGQHILFPPSVKGWDGGRSWINTSTLFVRQNAMVYLLTGRRPDGYAWQTDGSRFDATHLIADLTGDDGSPPTPEVASEYLLRFMLSGVTPHQKRIDAINEFFASCDGRLDNDVLIGALSLIAAMPEYQLC